MLLYCLLVSYYRLVQPFCVADTEKVPHKFKFTSLHFGRVYQFSKRHAMEESRQQVALSQGMRVKLEVQRLHLKEKLDQLGSKEPPSALKLDADTVSLSSNASSVCFIFLFFVFFILASIIIS